MLNFVFQVFLDIVKNDVTFSTHVDIIIIVFQINLLYFSS